MRAIQVQGKDIQDLITGLRKTDYRIWEPQNKKGRILICTASKRYKGYPCGYALCTAEIGKVTRYPGDALDGGDLYGWELKRIHLIEPFPMKIRARQGFFEVDDELVWECKGVALQDWFQTYYDPIRTW